MSKLEKLKEKLLETETAITVILTGGQEYRFNDGQIESMVRRADLSAIYKMKKALELEIESLEEPGGFNAF